MAELDADEITKPIIELNGRYTSNNGMKWECIAIRGADAWLALHGYTACKYSIDGTCLSIPDNEAYNINFETKRKTITLYGKLYDREYWFSEAHLGDGDKCKITFDLDENGKPDWSTIKGEDI